MFFLCPLGVVVLFLQCDTKFNLIHFLIWTLDCIVGETSVFDTALAFRTQS